MKIEFCHPAVRIMLSSCLVYGVAYAGRAYFFVNPLHAAVFSLATFTAAKLVKTLLAFDGHYKTIADRAKHALGMHTIAIISVGFGLLSPVQAIITLGLANLGSNCYHIMTGYSAWQA